MSLPERDALLLIRRETDESDFHGLDADAAQHELAIDDVADAGIDDLSVPVECCDRIRRAAERPDVLVAERRWNRCRRWGWRRRRRNDHRRRLTGVSDPVVIEVGLIGIEFVRTVVAKVGDAVLVAV